MFVFNKCLFLKILKESGSEQETSLGRQFGLWSLVQTGRLRNSVWKNRNYAKNRHWPFWRGKVFLITFLLFKVFFFDKQKKVCIQSSLIFFGQELVFCLKLFSLVNRIVAGVWRTCKGCGSRWKPNKSRHQNFA